MRNPFMVTLNEDDSDNEATQVYNSDSEATQVYDPNASNEESDSDDTDHMSQWGEGESQTVVAGQY